MEQPITDALLQFGPWLTVVFFFILPFIKDRLFPAVVEERKAKLLTETAREERLYTLIEKNTEAFTEMRGAVDELRDTLSEMRLDLRDVRTDVTFLYGKLNVERRPPTE